MAASIIASANPVGLWGEAASGSTTITWDTDISPRARVYLTTTTGSVTSAETLFDGDPAIGSDKGSKVLPVKFGSTYVLIMKQASNGATLASLVVTVKDLRAELTAEAARYAALDRQFGSIQAIYDVDVKVAIDTCRVRFKTIQPTIPRIQASDPSGQLVANLFPLFGGMRTEHDLILGDVTPLPLETELALTIVAAGHNALNLPIETVAKRAFTTGTRRAKVEFLQIDVEDDGDDFIKGEGDFTWYFYAGDPETGDFLASDSLKLPMPSGGPSALIKKTLDVPLAPRKLWVQAVALDNDTFFAGQPLDVPTYTGEGSSFDSTPISDRSQVTRIFKLEDRGDGSVIPIELATGDLDIDFTMKGRITLSTAAGKSPLGFSFSEWADGGRVTRVEGAGSRGKLKKFATDLDPNLDGRVQGHIVAKGADGTLYRRIVTAKRDWHSHRDWMRAAAPVEGTVTAVLTEHDRIALFTIDRAGMVLRADVGGSERPGAWHSLGGRFVGALTAAPRGRAVELVARDAEGVVHHRSIEVGSDPGDEWQRVGDRVQSQPIVVILNQRSFAVLALGHRGQVLIRHNRDGRWQARDWRVIEGVAGIRLGAAAIGGQGIALAVIDEHLQLHTLVARDEREINTEDWLPQGDLQEWLTRPLEPRAAPPYRQQRQIAAE